MPISLDSLVSQIDPSRAALLFGAGASLPSGAPSVGQLCDKLGEAISRDPKSFSFAELCSLVELKHDRKKLVSLVRKEFKNLRPSGGMLNIADFDWVSIFTTNYDDLVEKVYNKKDRDIRVFSSNFDFGEPEAPGGVPIFKIHGTIGLDTADGHRSRMVLTTEDNDLCEEYREALYDRLRTDISAHDLIIIGHSLSDPDLDSIIKRALKLKEQSGTSRNIFLLVFNEDEDRALLHETKGIKVSFGGIDEFFFELAKRKPERRKVYETSDEVIPPGSVLNPITINVRHHAETHATDFNRMFSGSPPSFADIRGGLTFSRSLQSNIVSQLLGDIQYEILLGASGVGKTALARKVALELVEKGFHGWEHQSDKQLFVDEWLTTAKRLADKGEAGVLILDEAHLYLSDVNRLVDGLASNENSALKLLIACAKNHWKPRVKSPELFRFGEVHELSQLDHSEVGGLLSFVEQSPQIAKLVDNSFRGFTKQEKRRRLIERCNRDFFVCLKNIFASENFDTIILKEYASINPDYQDVYKHICALESFGVRVHRQLLIRLLRISAEDVGLVLRNLDGLVEEYEIDARNSVFGWRGRHLVISEIISRHKFNNQDEVFGLLKKVVSNISPTYSIEIRTLRQLCSFDGGLPRIGNVKDQNELLRMMISVAPKERVPRHRLINNLIGSGAFPDAETEIRVFENDLGPDGPVRRYKVRLLVERAVSTIGLMPEDKASMLNEAYTAACKILKREPESRQTLQLYGDVCLELFKVTGDYSFVDDALSCMKSAEQDLGDPDITRLIYRFEQRVSPASQSVPEFETMELETD
ncbi:SIR2 family protein [Ruegeria arenilitoris]|uniref:SIR2 family protein n=1 Tax=Ruegeria arenilitoris TaxID=1173585 RepID=UPI001481306C|nr:SIR2 family protein [Ruegeria arenilitoris]